MKLMWMISRIDLVVKIRTSCAHALRGILPPRELFPDVINPSRVPNTASRGAREIRRDQPEAANRRSTFNMKRASSRL